MKSYLSLLCALSLTLFACKQNVVTGEGNSGAETRDITAAFNAVEVSNALYAVVTMDPAAPASVTIRGYENLLPHIKTEVKNKELKISVAETYRLENTGDLRIEITLPQLTELEASGASKLEVPAAIRADQLKVDASGASEIILADAQVAHLKAEASGASLLILKSGSVSKLETDISGSSKLDAFGAQVADAKISASGASKADVNVIQTLQADASGASVINYKGSPQVKSQASGAGSVSRAE